MKHRMTAVLSVISACLVAGGTLWAYFGLRGVGAQVYILHFNDLSGITEVGSLSTILLVGAFGLISVIISYFVAAALEERIPFLAKLAAVMTTAFAILLFIAFAAILNVN